VRTIRVAHLLVWTALLTTTGSAQSQRKLTLDDLNQLREVSAPELSPDGAWVAYTVTLPDTAKDQPNRDLWMTSWDGRRSVRLTTSPSAEGTPRWSPDGRYLAFLSSRDDSRDAAQVWLLDRSGGEAERVTNLPGGVSEYAWSPDSKRLVLVASDSDSVSSAAGSDSTARRTPRPIVIDRYQFKEDETGYLDRKRSHLYLFDLATRKPQILTPGDYNEQLPVWSPDGSSIAFISKRRPEFDRTNNWDLYVVAASPGATPRQLTTFPGPDMDPEWGGRPPAWSPDGKSIAYVQGGPLKLIYYAGEKLAVIPVAGGPARILTPTLDRNVLSPRWSRDGSSVLFLLEDDRVTHLASVPAQGGPVQMLTKGRRLVSDYSTSADGKITVLASSPSAPAEVFALDGGELRPLSRQNDGWLSQVQLAPVEEISFKSKDGTPVNGFLVRPVGYKQGTRVPTVLRIHGGPVYQFSNEFSFEWQILAAQGFAVLGANPRGSSGRGEKFSLAIWADWGDKDSQDVLGAVDYAVAQGLELEVGATGEFSPIR
jgi:dipeptidyl aminopeptidase/acylaminoacyl peptidase